jgi:hypothetical protein
MLRLTLAYTLVYSLTYKLAYTLRLTLRLTLAYTLVCLSVPWHLATSITANQQSLEGLYSCKLDTGQGGSDLEHPKLVASRVDYHSRERMASD